MEKQRTRLQLLTDTLKARNGASIKELALMLHVSEMTVRRDLRILDRSGITKTLHGSTIYSAPHTVEDFKDTYSLEQASTSHFNEKDRIGKFAASLIREKDIISIDTGTTTVALAHYLDRSLPITVLCYNSNILDQLLPSRGISLIFAGGYFHQNTLMFESPEGLDLICKTRTTKAFVSAAGIHKTLGLTCQCGYEIASKKALIKSSLENILLADSSKFSGVTAAYFADLKDFGIVITDTGLDDEWADYIRSLGITLYMV
jgi:DeoR family deoxyribose operon repressor